MNKKYDWSNFASAAIDVLMSRYGVTRNSASNMVWCSILPTDDAILANLARKGTLVDDLVDATVEAYGL